MEFVWGSGLRVQGFEFRGWVFSSGKTSHQIGEEDQGYKQTSCYSPLSNSVAQMLHNVRYYRPFGVQLQNRGALVLMWVAIKELKLSCYNEETLDLLYTVYPYFGNFT